MTRCGLCSVVKVKWGLPFGSAIEGQPCPQNWKWGLKDTFIAKPFIGDEQAMAGT